MFASNIPQWNLPQQSYTFEQMEAMRQLAAASSQFVAFPQMIGQGHLPPCPQFQVPQESEKTGYLSKEIGLEMADFVLSLVGMTGPISIDTRINGHQCGGVHLPPGASDLFVLGSSDQAITVQEIRDLLKKMAKYANLPQFNNGRSYCFEGVSQNGEKSYVFSWGS